MFNKKTALTLGASALLVLTACGNGDSANEGEESEGASGEPNELTVWTWDPNFNVRALEIAEEHYKQDNPDFELEIVENSQDDVIQKLNTSLSSGVETGLPNIVFIEDYRAQSFLSSYPGSFVPLEEYYNTDDFADYKIKAGTYEDEVFNVPFDSGVTGLYVRTDLLEEAGYTLEDVTDITWDEYVEIGKDVTEKTGVKWMTNDHNDLGIIRVMMQSSGVWLTEEDGETPYITDNESLKLGFETYKELFESGVMNVHNDWDQFLQAFNNGEVATVPTGNWITPSITAEDSQSGDWAIAPIPRQTIEGSVNASNLGGSSIYVLNIDNNELAGEFLGATFGSDVDFYQDLATEINAIGAYEPAAEGEAYQVESEFFGGQMVNKNFAEWTQEIPEVEFGGSTYEIEDILAVSLQDYLNGADLDEVLEKAQQQAESGM
ncbi:ABC transporter substrate-binding protein [Marinilactibacillus kalidii]|uniref:ABC transporter substrate-binding protein n=1 Tax=Marinilactibacillus kalidii TaxID=2820274 RepID=UPI001ABDC2B4|nr:extracellular solute-binding protein [Marinilactibacillus kalidii]